MNSQTVARWAWGLVVAGLLVGTWTWRPSFIDGGIRDDCFGPTRTAYGLGVGESCRQATDRAFGDALGNALQRPRGCTPCWITQGPTSCAAASRDGSNPSNPYTATTSIIYRCESCSGGPPSM